MDPDRVDLSPIENFDISAGYLSLPDVNHWMIGWAAAKSLAVPWRCWFVLQKTVDVRKDVLIPRKANECPPWKGTAFQKNSQILQLSKERSTFSRVVWNTLPKTNSSPLKMNGWKTNLSFWNGSFFRGHVRFRRCSSTMNSALQHIQCEKWICKVNENCKDNKKTMSGRVEMTIWELL